MGTKKQRSTTSMTYSIDPDYDKVLKQSKRIYRSEELFYIGMVLSSYCSYSEADLKIYPDTKVNEKWIFQNNKWVKEVI